MTATITKMPSGSTKNGTVATKARNPDDYRLSVDMQSLSLDQLISFIKGGQQLSEMSQVQDMNQLLTVVESLKSFVQDFVTRKDGKPVTDEERSWRAGLLKMNELSELFSGIDQGAVPPQSAGS